MKSIKRRMAKAILRTYSATRRGEYAGTAEMYCRHCGAKFTTMSSISHSDGCIVLESMRIANVPKKEKESA